MFNDIRTLKVVRFCTVGLGNMVVDVTSFFLLMFAGLPYLSAQVLSYSVGVVNSFYFNRKWTFGITDEIKLPEVMRFIMVNGVSLVVTFCLIFILHDFSYLNLCLCKLLATGGGIVINFMGSKLWVFVND